VSETNLIEGIVSYIRGLNFEKAEFYSY